MSINIDNAVSRNEILTSFLLGSSYPIDHKNHVLKMMVASTLFPEYTDSRVGICQGGIILSLEVVYAQTPFPYTYKPELVFTIKEVLAAYKKEEEYRKKCKLLEKLSMVNQIDNLENVSIEDIKESISKVLDKYKTNYNYNPEWDLVAQYEKKLLTPFECIKTGISEFDEKCFGLRLGHLSVLLGFVGQGKSTIALNLAYKAISQGKNVLFLSTELTKEDIVYQLATCASFNLMEKDKAFTYKGFLTNEHNIQKIKTELQDSVLSKLKNPDLFGKFMPANVEDVYDYSLAGLRQFCESLPVYPDLFIVDYFQRLPVEAKSRDEWRFKLSSMVQNFTNLALGNERYRHMAVLLNSQTSRSGYKDTKDQKDRSKTFKYDLTAASEISELEKEASLFFAIRQSQELNDKGCISLDVMKCRGGMPIEVEVPIIWRFLSLGNQVGEAPDTSFDVEKLMSQGTFGL